MQAIEFNSYAIGGLFGQFIIMQEKTEKWPNTGNMGTHLRVLKLSNEYQYDMV